MLSTSASQLASMMFSLTPTVPQTSSSSRLSMTTRTRGGGAGVGVDDADLVVDQLHLGEVGRMPHQRLPQGGVEGVHRAVALAHGVLDRVADAELHRRLGDRRARRRRSRRSRGSASRSNHGWYVPGRLLHQQVERRLGRLELVALRSPGPAPAVRIFVHQRLVVAQMRTWPSWPGCSTGRTAR